MSIFGQNPTPTAWVVHLVGYLAGFVITFGILSIGLIQSSEYDITQMFKQSHRRRAYKKVIESSRTFHKNIEPKLNREQQLSKSIGQEVATGQIESAVDNYLLALKEFSSFKVDQRSNYLIGATLLQTNRIHEGVEIFERYLIQYPNAKDRGEVALLLAAKYTRNLVDFKRASELLKKYKSDFAEQHQDLANTIEGELQ